MTPKQLKQKRDAKGHFKASKLNAKKLPKAHTSYPIANTNTERLRPLATQQQINALKKGMSEVQKATLENFMKQSQEIHGIKDSFEKLSISFDKHYNNLQYIDQVSRTPENTQDAIEDKTTFNWLRKLRNEFYGKTSLTTYPYPITKEQAEAMAIKWAKRPIQIGFVYSVYVSCLLASIAGGNAEFILAVAGFGLIIATALAFYIWDPTRE